MVAEKALHRRPSKLFSTPEAWAWLLPDVSKTVRVRALAFRLLSRLARAMEELVNFRNRSPQVSIFKLLRATDEATPLLGLNKCRRGAFLSDMIKRHPHPR